MNASARIKEKGREFGFELVGIAPAHPAPDFDFFRWWLDRGYAGTMNYLKRGEEKRGDPAIVLPGVKSVICCGLNYYTESKSPHPPFAKGGQGGISRYAWGDDYHEVVGERLTKLERFIALEIDPTVRTKSYVDTGPILERSYAARAGLGWIGKNTCLINNGIGSYVFLGEVLTTLEFDESEYDRPALNQCGTCSKCLDACPTGALVEPYILDSNRCISYLTIEHRGDFSPKEETMVGEHLYGCDICQEVCPYNERIPESPMGEFKIRPEIQDAASSEFEKMTRRSAIERINFSQWERNLRAVRRNSRSGL